MDKTDILSLSYDELKDLMKAEGHPAFRADQLFSWLHNKNVNSFDEMTNLSLETREWLKQTAHLNQFSLKQKQVSELDGTVKYLFELEDGNAIESVQMKYKHGDSLCVSTQVGCAMGCKFCASTIGGLVRNLTTGEILNQVYYAQKLSGERISNIVLMGIGEPLNNFDNVAGFLKTVSHPKGLNISLRHISLSTCGLVPEMKKLAELNMPITLSVSLHAPNNKRRSEIMPVNRRWNIEELLKASKAYFDKTGRRITFEYALIEGVNDTRAEAKELGELLKGINCHINLIPVNPVQELGFSASNKKAVEDFRKTLERMGYAATVRRELGRDISAACGQLRHEDSII